MMPYSSTVRSQFSKIIPVIFMICNWLGITPIAYATSSYIFDIGVSSLTFTIIFLLWNFVSGELIVSLSVALVISASSGLSIRMVLPKLTIYSFLPTPRSFAT